MEEESLLDAAETAADFTLAAIYSLIRPENLEGLPVGPHDPVGDLRQGVERLQQRYQTFSGLYGDAEKQLKRARPKLPARPLATVAGEKKAVFALTLVNRIAGRIVRLLDGREITEETLPLFRNFLRTCVPGADDLDELLERLKGEFSDAREVLDTPGDRATVDCFITLYQAAAMVSRSKKTLERRKKNMPMPKVAGGGGKPDEWAWSELRPWLEKEFERSLPERFPADRLRTS